MASHTIADLASFRNQQIHVNEQMLECLRNLEALVTVTLNTRDFFELTKSTMHCYFSTVAALIEEMSELSQANLNLLNLHEK